MAEQQRKSLHVKFFYALGATVAEHHKKTIVTSLAIAVALTAGIVTMEQHDDIRDYVPSVSIASQENAIGQQFFGQEGNMGRLTLAVQAADGGNMLRASHMRLFTKL